ncbi:DoxX-like protein [Isoptericola sp. CG 20/1183]|uniref:DoxX-like protein n=1 Tax=Isoptericola halotolerans TaxID=300560 RepID=A0ABX5EEB0_9MICO|nr:MULTISPECIES: DoxX family membrane protein [Isoptericola]PRZ04890.1 DoxX-like protein [Isoptericola halotolerans]PRZ05381.1 DoxX-like protein [Isoptericola sp. CG 20/1183]
MLLRRLARPLLAVPFVYDGLSAALHPAEHTAAARDGADRVTQTLGVDRLDDTQVSLLVRAHGAVTVAAGLLLAVGRAPRTAALTLAALSAPLAVVNQPFSSQGELRTEKTGKFVRNLGAVGAAVIAGIDLEGRPGMSYRIGQQRAVASRTAKHTVEAATKDAKHAASSASRSVKHATKDAKHAAGSATKDARLAARQAKASVAKAKAKVS